MTSSFRQNDNMGKKDNMCCGYMLDIPFLFNYFGRRYEVPGVVLFEIQILVIVKCCKIFELF